MLLSMTGLLSAQSSPSNDSVRYRFGIYFNLDSRSESLDLPIPEYSSFCGTLQDGSGSSWNVGGLLDVGVLPWLTLGGRLGFSRASGEMRHAGDPFPLRGETNEVITGRVDQVIDYQNTGIEAVVSCLVPFAMRLRGSIGLGAWFRLFSEEAHREVAVLPSTLLLSNSQRELDLRSGGLFAYRPVVPLANVGLHYDLPIGAGSYLSLEPRLTFPLLDRTTSGSWRTLRLGIGGSIRFGISGDRPDEPPIQPVDTTPQRLPVLIADVLTDPQVVTVEITEYDSTEALPLLNKVFFEENSSDIPKHYHLLSISETAQFSTAQLNGPTLEVYRDLLNVVGLRMSRLPNATLRITGHRNGRESVQGLALARAEAVKDYLVNVWEIFPERITVEDGKLPPEPAPERSEEGLRENAHVSLEPDNPNVMLPVLRKYIQRIATPPSVRFYPKAIAEAGVIDWQLDIEGDEGIWKSIAGTGRLPDSIRWDWTSDSGTLSTIPIELSYRLTVRDSLLQQSATPTRLIDVRLNTIQDRLENRVNDTVIESYSLLLFDYDSPEVSLFDRGLIRAIAGRVRQGANVRFTGYTDSLGDARRNNELALQRAEEAAKIFRAAAPKGVNIRINDQGGERERFPFNTPEGRSYNRTVVIEVRMPAEGS